MSPNVNTTAPRSQVSTASGLNLLVAIWLFISAFVVTAYSPMVTNNILVGIAVFILAAIRAGGAYDQGWLSWVNALLGVWTIVSPWAVMGGTQTGPSQATIISNVITGAAIVVLGCWSALASTAGTPAVTTTAYPEGPRPSFGR
jgi:hypothetical protein